jgi:hypothetical protein
MAETLLSQSAVKMFGRVLEGVEIRPVVAAGAPGLGFNLFLKRQLAGGKDAGGKDAGGKDSVPMFARIYAFSFEGAFYNLPRPAIFVVHGPGQDIRGAGTYDYDDKKGRGPASTDDSGIPAREFVFESDIKYWEYDKDDLSLRLDSFSGTLDDILIEASLSSTSRSGLVARSGMAARSGAAADGDETMRHRLR